MVAERVQIQTFIILSLLAHFILVGLLSVVRISVPFPVERPLRVRIVDQPASKLKRPPADRSNVGESETRAQRPAEKEGPPRTLESLGIPDLASAPARLAIPSLPPAAETTAPASSPRAVVPAPLIPPPPLAPPSSAVPSAARPLPAPPTAATVSPSPGAPAPVALGSEPASPRAVAAPRTASVPAPEPLGRRIERDGKGLPPALSSEPAATGVSSARPGATDSKGAQGGRPQSGGVEGMSPQYDLRGQVAMLWKNLDPRHYTATEADIGEEGDTGSTTERTVSLDSQDSRYASYLLGVKRRIENLWDYPPEARGLTGNLAVTFSISRDGRLKDLQLAETSGIAPLDNEAIRAIREAAPFAPFPDRMRFERLNIRAAFYYYASRARAGGR
ncbi:MAG: energy transducer TonB [Candidatus Methylomirabilis sp.]